MHDTLAMTGGCFIMVKLIEMLIPKLFQTNLNPNKVLRISIFGFRI
jgi:hypothetical protein